MQRAGRRALDDSQHSPAQERPAPTTPEVGVLALQRSAGNQAVAALLARDATKEKPKEKAPVTGSRVEFPDIGAVPIESMQWAGGGGRPGGGQNDPTPSEIIFTSKPGDHSSDLMRKMLQGEAQDVEVFFGGMKLKLKGALVSSYQTSSGEKEPTETWTLNFQGVEFEGQKKQDDKEPSPDRYPG